MLECMYRTPEKKKIVQKDQAGNLVTTLTYESEIAVEEEPVPEPDQEVLTTPEKEAVNRHLPSIHLCSHKEAFGVD